MITPAGFFMVVFAVLGFFYWLDSMQAKELARRIGKARCDQEGVGFLDDSVVLKRVGLRRSPRSRISLYRKYQFEFTSDGSRRYRGEIELLNKQLDSVTMEPYRIPELH
jgi:hypothetical protein